jgi:hypothetical protein
MQDSSLSLPEKSQQNMSLSETPRAAFSWRGIRKSLIGAFLLLFWDAVLGGTFLTSLMICPIWFLVSLFKNIIQLPGWRIALVRIAMPVLVLGLVLANDSFQYKIGEKNVHIVIDACEKFHAANGEYPKSLDELVPQYLPHIPRAKYCLAWGEFMYFNNGHPMLVWYIVPPHGRKIYTFVDRRWNYID